METGNEIRWILTVDGVFDAVDGPGVLVALLEP